MADLGLWEFLNYFCSMESTRQNKISRLIQKEMGELLQQSAQLFPGAMITVTRVNVTPDLSLARVNVSIFATDNKESVLKSLDKHSRELRFLLGKRIHNQVRIIPDLQFFIDDTLDYLEKIDNLLKQ
jgi:ribosome-binding factor A